MINYSKKFIFVHIYKTAGTSIREKLSIIEGAKEPYVSKGIYNRLAYKVSKKLRIYGFNFFSNSAADQVQLWKHAGALEYKSLLGDKYFEFFSFAFVRNPYDWQVSIYEYIRKSTSHSLHEFCNAVTFKDYLYSQVAESIRPQTNFIFDIEKKEIMVSFVGKFETLEKDWLIIAPKIGSESLSLGHLNSSNRNNTLSTYYDKESIEIIKKRFFLDFKYFDYPIDPQF